MDLTAPCPNESLIFETVFLGIASAVVEEYIHHCDARSRILKSRLQETAELGDRRSMIAVQPLFSIVDVLLRAHVGLRSKLASALVQMIHHV